MKGEVRESKQSPEVPTFGIMPLQTRRGRASGGTRKGKWLVRTPVPAQIRRHHWPVPGRKRRLSLAATQFCGSRRCGS